MQNKTRRLKRAEDLPSIPVLAGICLGHTVYRGFAPLNLLASLSKADIFDQQTNRLGTQRNLSRQHARKAYQYVATEENAFFPELVLNLRDGSYVEFVTTQKGRNRFGTLEFKKDPRIVEEIVISRMDGNHRLWYADGHEKGMEAVTRPVSFCLLTLRDRKGELELFRDINDNQMGMNTSHLQNITARLLGSKALKTQNPALYIVQQLQRNKDSPLFQRLHEGGKVRKAATLGGLTVANLVNAVRDMLARSAKLSQFADADAQYNVIRNFWQAVKLWLPDAWSKPGNYIIFKGVGLYALTYIGVDVIDRCLLKGKYQPRDMLVYLRRIDDIDVLRSGHAIAYAGRAGGRKLANDLVADIAESDEISVSKLQRLILGDRG
jgi:DGQHR domain-containing protein